MKRAETVKDIYFYPLKKDFRVKLGLPAGSGLDALKVADGLGADTWAQKEFGGAPLGDKRLSSRLVDCVDAKSKKPDLTFSGVAKGDWPAVIRILPADRPSGRIGCQHGKYSSAPPGTYDTAHERAKDRAVYPGWH